MAAHRIEELEKKVENLERDLQAVPSWVEGAMKR